MSTVPDRLAAALADRYRIERELGQGGMATVYLAEDLKHKRHVALKVLKPELAAVLGAERFVQEITTTAALQHPHILPLFDSGTADGFLFYVMPFIDGETLRGKLDRETQLGIDEAVRITTEVADALDYAHSRGVIHRDIKPENILLANGRPMVADFGIALAVSAAAGGRMTETGLSLGTPYYMSPEQATAEKVITARADVYSLGTVLYEMLAGQPPHTGASAQQIIMKIVTEEADLVTKVRKAVPPNVVMAVAKSLQKLPADRFESARAFADALVNPSFTVAGTMPGFAGGGSERTSGVSRRLFIGVAALAVVLLATTLALALRPTPVPDVAIFSLDLPDSVTVATGGGTKVAISRDGSRIAIFAQEKRGTYGLYVRRIDQPVAQLVRGSEGTPVSSGYSARFSPDGESLIYATTTGIRRVSVTGGAAQLVEETGAMPSWGDGGVVVHVRGNDLWIGSAEGRNARLLATPDTATGVFSLRWPHVLPGGEYALVARDRAFAGNVPDSLRLGVISLKDGSITDLDLPGTDPKYVATGHIVFGRSGGLVLAAPFSLKSRTVTGAPTLLVESVWSGTGGATSFAAADNGTLVYQESSVRSVEAELTVVTADGRERRIATTGASYSSPKIAPDGRRVAVGTGATPGQVLWLIDLSTGTRERLGSGSVDGFRSQWTPDGARVVLIRQARGLMEVVSRAWDRSAPDQVLAVHSAKSIFEVAVNPSHGPIVYRASDNDDDNLYLAPADSLSALRPLVATPAFEASPTISADGRLLGYVSDESGALEVYVQPLPGPGPRVQVSVNGGEEPVWSKSGNTLFYRGPARIMRATIGGNPVQVLARDSLFLDRFRRDGTSLHQNWDVFPGDREFLMIRSTSERSGLLVVLNWPQLHVAVPVTLAP